MAQIIYTAGTTFLLAAAQAVLPSQVAASLDKARSCLEMLREIGSSWESGHQKAIILEELYKEYTHASVDITGIAGGMGSSWTSRQGEHQPGNTESDALAVTLPSMHAQDPLPAADEYVYSSQVGLLTHELDRPHSTPWRGLVTSHSTSLSRRCSRRTHCLSVALILIWSRF